jgi:hypothetical protein
MTRIDHLVALYRLALQAPGTRSMGEFKRWLDARQVLVNLMKTQVAQHPEIEKALAALIADADRPTYDSLLSLKREVALQMRYSRMDTRGYGGYRK